jgi:hypothetical protein
VVSTQSTTRYIGRVFFFFFFFGGIGNRRGRHADFTSHWSVGQRRGAERSVGQHMEAEVRMYRGRPDRKRRQMGEDGIGAGVSGQRNAGANREWHGRVQQSVWWGPAVTRSAEGIEGVRGWRQPARRAKERSVGPVGREGKGWVRRRTRPRGRSCAAEASAAAPASACGGLLAPACVGRGRCRRSP